MFEKMFYTLYSYLLCCKHKRMWTCLFLTVVIILIYILIISKYLVSIHHWKYPIHIIHDDFENTSLYITECQGTTKPHVNSRYAIVSLLSGDFNRYGHSALKLGHSIRKFTNMDMIMMVIASKILPQKESTFLTNIGWKVCIVPCIEGPSNQSTQNRFLEAKLYTKIYAWKLIQYQAVLFLDSDTLVVNDFYDIFTIHLNNMIQSNHSFGAARDRPADTYCRFGTAWNYFNAGVMLLLPNLTHFEYLKNGIYQVPHNVAYAEQDFLNKIYPTPKSFYEMPFAYNAIVTSKVCEPSIWKEEQMKIVHFTTAKGWMYSQHWNSIQDPFQCWWWNVQDLCMLWEAM